MEIAPIRKMTIEMTPAKMGRLMKKSEIFMEFAGKAVAGEAALRAAVRRRSWFLRGAA
jgi:hypothetical protein